MNNNYQKMKKRTRPMNLCEQAGMSNLLSGLKRIREQATQKTPDQEETLTSLTKSEKEQNNADTIHG